MSTINQKEYLKKYLGIGKSPGEKKKKKKKEKAIGNRLKIIDDNIDVLISQEIEHDIAAENEDAPQIVAVIDERPLSLQIDEKTYSNLWKPIGQPSTTEADIQSLKLNTFKQLKNTDFQKSMLRVTKESISYDKRNKSLLTNVEQDNYSARREREKSNSPLRKNESNYNVSPAQRNINSDSPPKKKGKDYDDSKKSFRQDYSNDYSDYSPPRRKNKERSTSPKQTKNDISPLNKRYEHDNSPPRKRNTDDSSPPRRKNRDIYSPPRRNKKDDVSPPRRKNNGDNSPPRRNKEYDNSPPRRNKKNDSSSPKRREKEDDSSPPRKRSKDYKNSPPRRGQRSDNSPPRQRKNDYTKETRVNEEDQSPQRKRYKENSLSPKLKNKDDRKIKREGKKSRWNVEGSPEPSSSEKLRKTLDGKRAGLQSAEDLFIESKHLRQKEDEIFKKMSAEISGRNAATVVRGKKIKDLEEEAAREKREKEMKEKYDRWGKGLKQVEDQNKRIEEQLHEMNKPLARYADDEDLEKFLKEQEREGDPMLAYIRKKKKKEKVAAGISEKPMYLGEFMPNRFGIRPGYRWDGVDRSNGYEKKWFQVQNAKKANREEAFKWSTEDM